MINGEASIVIEVHRLSSDVQKPVDNTRDNNTPHQNNFHGYNQSQSFHIKGEQATPPPIYYKFITIYSTTKMSSLLSKPFDRTVRVELDAEAILNHSMYQFEMMFSNNNLLAMELNPTQYHQILDSMFHKIIATSLPDPSMADIWFEFPDIDSAAVGAHEQVLNQSRFFADWIERERRVQGENRRRQLENERIIHDHHQQTRDSDEIWILNQNTKLGNQSVPQRSITPSEVAPPRYNETRGSQHTHPIHRHSDSLTSVPQMSLVAENASLHAQYSSIRPVPHHFLGSQQCSFQLLPALRIAVTSISPETLKVLLQALYTSKIQLSKKQIQEYNALVGTITEDRRAPLAGVFGRWEDYNHLFNNWGITPRPSIFLPPLTPSLTDHMTSCKEFCAFSHTSFTAPLLDRRWEKHHTSAISNRLQFDSPWIPCTRKNSNITTQTSQITDFLKYCHQDHPRKQDRRSSGCTWETLIDISTLCGFDSLVDLSLRGIQHHCQMLAIHSLVDGSIKSESPYQNPGEARLDLHLALSEHVLQSYLKLYDIPLSPNGRDLKTINMDIGENQQDASSEKFILHMKRITTKQAIDVLQWDRSDRDGSQPQHPFPQVEYPKPFNILSNHPRFEEALTELLMDIRRFI
ncbi:hypothetical protein BGZ76_004476 [Entomortierella beljakovae]|nr:hypothetical protein BGZ76_004476 [Entomortierella beljakovae]